MSKHTISGILVIAMGLSGMLALPAQGVIRGPYTADSDTLGLWHLNDADPGPATPAPGTPDNWNLNLENGATLGNASYAGFGTALNITAPIDPNVKSNANAGSRPVTAVTGANGAFSFEALIETSTITGAQQEIISMENDGNPADRPFQFVIITSGGVGKLGFTNVGGADGPQSVLASIPTTGPDAFVAGAWFQVAVTYNPDAVGNNLDLYWTRVDPSNTTADLIGSGTMASLNSADSGIFEIGNTGRDTFDDPNPAEGAPLLGSIDEVRISDIARTSDEFIFTTPEPASLGLLAVGGMMLLSRGRKQRSA